LDFPADPIRVDLGGCIGEQCHRREKNKEESHAIVLVRIDKDICLSVFEEIEEARVDFEDEHEEDLGDGGNLGHNFNA
jgi:hypothetical protein